MKRTLISLLIIFITSPTAFADYKITQKTTVEGVGSTVTVYAKGVRIRRETKTEMDDPEVAAMMAQMMPGMNSAEIYQCDLKQNITINDQKRAYFIDYYDWTSLTPEQKKRFPNTKMVIKGTMNVSGTVTDSGRRQQMFGLTARWLKYVMTTEISADSCEGKASVRSEQEGWFADLQLDRETCPIPPTPDTKGGCRPKLIIGPMQDPGFFLEGTTKMFENNKLQGTFKYETLAVSKTPLDQALFEIPKAYAEVESLYQLTTAGDVSNTAGTVDRIGWNSDGGTGFNTGKKDAGKTVAIDFFSGNVSKIDQDMLRGYIAQKLSAAGMNGVAVSGRADITSGNFGSVIGVRIVKVKESGASKIGGLFGKVTGSDDATKLGESEAEIVMDIYGSDGKTVVASSPASAKIKGTSNDAVKAAIDQAIVPLVAKINKL
jgi:hypothetical protein